MQLHGYHLFEAIELYCKDYSKDSIDLFCKNNGYALLDIWSFATAIGKHILINKYSSEPDLLKRYNSFMETNSPVENMLVSQSPSGCCGGGEVK